MERDSLAREIIHTCLEMTRLGLNQGTAGNVSVRYHDGMLITPTGIPYENLTESHIVYIDADGKPEAVSYTHLYYITALMQKLCITRGLRYGQNATTTHW